MTHTGSNEFVDFVIEFILAVSFVIPGLHVLI